MNDKQPNRKTRRRRDKSATNKKSAHVRLKMTSHGQGKLFVGQQEIGNVAGIDIRCAVGNANECHVMLIPHEVTVEGEFEILASVWDKSGNSTLDRAVEEWKLQTLREALLELGQPEADVDRLLGLEAPEETLPDGTTLPSPDSPELTESPKSSTTETPDPEPDS